MWRNISCKWKSLKKRVTFFTVKKVNFYILGLLNHNTTLLPVPVISVSESHSVMSDSLWPPGLYRPWNSPGQNTGVGSISLSQGIFLTQELNRGLLHCRKILYQLCYQGSPVLLSWTPKSCQLGTCECNLIGIWGLCRFNHFRYHHSSLRLSLNLMIDVFIKRKKFKDTKETDTQKMAMWKWRQKLEGCSNISRNVKDCRQSLEARKRQGDFFPRAFRRSMALLTTWFWTSGSLNYKRMNFCYFKLCSLW